MTRGSPSVNRRRFRRIPNEDDEFILSINASFSDCGILQESYQGGPGLRVITEQNYNDAKKLLETLSESLGD